MLVRSFYPTIYEVRHVKMSRYRSLALVQPSMIFQSIFKLTLLDESDIIHYAPPKSDNKLIGSQSVNCTVGASPIVAE